MIAHNIEMIIVVEAAKAAEELRRKKGAEDENRGEVDRETAEGKLKRHGA